MRGVTRPLLLACGLVLAWALPAIAAPTWSPSLPLSGQGNAVGLSPSVAINDGGLGVEAWSETIAGAIVIRAARHANGGAWKTDTDNVSGVLPGSACTPFASIDPAGNALVVWTQFAGSTCFSGNETLLFATRAAGASSWTAPGVVGASAVPGSAITTAAVNNAGQMVVAWSTSDVSSNFINASVGSPTSGFGNASTLVTVPHADSLYYLAAAIGPSGDAAVQWEHFATAGNIEVSVRAKGGSFQATPTPLTTFTGSTSAYNGSLAIDASGDVLSAYSVGTSFVSQLKTAGSATWQPAQTIDTSSLDSWISVGLDAAGNATAVWLQEQFPAAPAPHLGQLFGATRPAGPAGTWAAGSALSGVLPGQYAPPNLLVAASGAAVVVWEDADPQNAVQALYRPAGGVFGPLTAVGAGSGERVALAPSGDAAISFIGAATDARISVLDTTPPTVASATVPATATTGQPVAMAATGVDAWSGLAPGQPSWTFGDGATGGGATVSHTYAKAGVYSVTIGVIDGVGIAGGPPVIRQITVLDPPPPPPPTITLAAVKPAFTWKSSRLVGSVKLSGTIGVSTTLAISVRRHGASKVVLSTSTAVKAGPWTHVLKLPAGFAPGSYDLSVTGPGGLSAKAGFAIAAPKSGIVTHAYASGPQHGPAVTRLSSTSELWAHFSFGTLPGKGRKITTQWTLPGGRKLGANVRPRTRLVEAEIKQLGTHSLPTGLWHCVIRAGGVIVATVNVRLS